MRGNKNGENKNEYIECKDNSDFETENYSSDNEFVQRTGLLYTSVDILLLRVSSLSRCLQFLQFFVLLIFITQTNILNSKQIVLEKKLKCKELSNISFFNKRTYSLERIYNLEIYISFNKHHKICFKLDDRFFKTTVSPKIVY